MKSPIRIAFLSEHASPVALLGSADAGGQNVYVDELSRHLAALGYAVDVFTRRESASAPEVIHWARGVRVINLRAGSPQVLPKDEVWALMPAFRDALLDFMARDRVHYDLIHGNFWMSGWVAAELRQRLGIPAVQIFHALGQTKRRHQGSADTSPPDRIEVEREIVQCVDRVIAQCPSERAELLDDYHADPRKIAIVPSAVNGERFKPVSQVEARRIVGLDEQDLLITYVGRMLPRKDVRNIVHAVGLLAARTNLPVKLLVVGGASREPDPALTPEIGALQTIAAELGISDRVHFAGQRQPDVLRFYYSAGDVAVTTPWYEPYGLTPLEAMACGRPVIGSAVGGLTFTIVDGETGFLVPPRDPEALALSLHQLLTSPELRGRMGRAARRRVKQEFTWPTVAQRTAALYETLLRQAEPRAMALGAAHL